MFKFTKIPSFSFFSHKPKPEKTVLPDGPVYQFIQALKQEHQKLEEKGFPEDYKPLLYRVSEADIKGILQWIIQNPLCLKGLSPTNPIRIGAAKSSHTSGYPFPITIHFTMDTAGHVQLTYDPNSKLARHAGSIIVKKDAEVKDGEKPLKQRGQGVQKTVRDTWSFRPAVGKLEPTVGNVVKGKRSLKMLRRAQHLYQADNPFLMPMAYGAEYMGHGKKDKGQRKAIAFAPRAEGELFDLIKHMDTVKPDLADILWIHYTTIKSVAFFHAGGRLHRDIKPENFLFLHNPYGITVYLNDWDCGIKIEESKLIYSEVGSPLYMAFDRPLFNELLNAHNDALKEIAWFKTEEAQRLYLGKEMKPEESHWYKEYMASYQIAQKDENTTLFQDYMGKRTHEIVQKLLKINQDFSYAIDIVLNSKEPIPLNTPHHAKDDVWALCLTLSYLIENFIDYQHYHSLKPMPLILKEINQLLSANLIAVRPKRMDAAMLYLSFGTLLIQLLEGPMIGINEKEQRKCIEKFYAQLMYHHTEIHPLSASLSGTRSIVLPQIKRIEPLSMQLSTSLFDSALSSSSFPRLSSENSSAFVSSPSGGVIPTGSDEEKCSIIPKEKAVVSKPITRITAVAHNLNGLFSQSSAQKFYHQYSVSEPLHRRAVISSLSAKSAPARALETTCTLR